MIQVDLMVVHAAELLACAGPAGGVRRPSSADLGLVVDGAVAVLDGVIVAVGTTEEISARYTADQLVDVSGRLVTPGLVDPHTHLVHGGSRHIEWEHKVTGLPLTGMVTGIESTRAATCTTSSADLLARAIRDLDTALANGTTTLEAKSGYGLEPTQELRILGVMDAIEHPVDVVKTFLGAHVVPAEFADRRAEFVQSVVDMLPAARNHAEWFDVWCDPIAFTPAETSHLLTAATSAGFSCRVHADQTGGVGGTGLAVAFLAASADHLDEVSKADLADLGRSTTVAVLLPGCTLHQFETQVRDWAAWARRIFDSNAVVALSTDYNPGTCPTVSMQTIMGLAARLYRMSAAEIWLAATLNAAASLRRGDRIGSIEVGKQADLALWSIASHQQVINRFGENLVDIVIKRGRIVAQNGRRL